MTLTILYFAWVRERIGQAEETVTLPDHVATVGDLVAWLATRGGGYAEAMAEPERLRAAVDQNSSASMRRSDMPARSRSFRR